MQGVTKNGYYPAAPEAIGEILKHLKLPPDPPGGPDLSLNILDPCAGEAKALADIDQGLSLCTNQHIGLWAVELNATRAERIAANYPDINLLGPCSFHSAEISRRSFGMIYLNPPFDNEFGGGGREELSFLRRCSDLLCLEGILVFVLPFNQVFGQAEMLFGLDHYYEDTELYLFPDGHRPYRECVVFARRRKAPLPFKEVETLGILHRRGFRNRYVEGYADLPDIPRLGQTQYDHWKWGKPVELSRRDELNTWTIPYSWAPRQFTKKDLTCEEIEFELARSPLHAKLRPEVFAAIEPPPLPLNKGHTSMLLLTGLLDGFVPSDPPHVVRGDCGKRKRLARTEEHTTEAGTHVEKRVYAEQPAPVCRAVWPDGTIRTFTDKPADQSEGEDFQIEETGEEVDE